MSTRVKHWAKLAGIALGFVLAASGIATAIGVGIAYLACWIAKTILLGF